MALQLSGDVPIDITFTSDGTRGQLYTQFVTNLTAIGWGTISAVGSDTILESGLTPQGLKVRIEVIDPGSGNCIQFKIRDNTTLIGPQTIFLLPSSGNQFRLWA